MSNYARRFLIVAMLPFACWAATTDSPNAQPPGSILDLPSATLEMKWSDLRALLLQARAAEEETAPPPIECTVSSAQYRATAVSPKTLRVEGRFTITVWKRKGWTQASIIGDRVAPTSVMLDGEAASLARTQDGHFALLLDTPGTHTLELTFYVACEQHEGLVRCSFPTVPTPLTEMHLDLPIADANVRAPEAAGLSVNKTKDGQSVDLVFPPADAIAVEWKLPAPPAPPVPPAPEEEPRIACTTSILATVGDRFLVCQALVQYEMLRGKANAFRLRLPASANLFDLSGQGVASSTVDGVNDQQRVDVRLNHQVDKTYVLTLRYETPIPEEAKTIEAPALVVEDVVRQTGYIGVTARGPVLVDVGKSPANLRRVDTSDLPPGVTALSVSPILLAFKYTVNDYRLPLDVHRLKDVAVRVAVIDDAALTTVVTEGGLAVTRAAYRVRNNVKQFLRITLPEGAKVWSAEVNGKPVKPATEDGDETVLIPLLKSVENERSMGAFPVAVVYEEQMPLRGGAAGRATWIAPAVDILSNETTWDFYLPESRPLYRASGDLDAMPERAARNLLPLRRRTGTAHETLMPLREGIERFFITDINNPAAPQLGGENRYKGAPMSAPVQEPMDIAIAGVLPIQIDLPTTGVLHRFQTVLTPQDKTLSMTLYTCDSRLRYVFYGLLLIIGAGLGCAVVRLVARQARGARLLVGVAIFALAFVAAFCGAWLYVPIALWALAGLLFGALAGALTRFRRLATQTQTETAQEEAGP
jgi:hypothetical protein